MRTITLATRFVRGILVAVAELCGWLYLITNSSVGRCLHEYALSIPWSCVRDRRVAFGVRAAGSIGEPDVRTPIASSLKRRR